MVANAKLATMSLLVMEFQFANPDVKKDTLTFENEKPVCIPMIGDWVQPANYMAIPLQVTKRIFSMTDQSTTIVLFCE